MEKNDRVKFVSGRIGYVCGPRCGDKILIGYPDGRGETRDYFDENKFRWAPRSKKYDWVQIRTPDLWLANQ